MNFARIIGLVMKPNFGYIYIYICLSKCIYSQNQLLKNFYNKMHITHIKGLQHILRLELRLEINQEA